jgi:hypothetical protein
LRALFVSSLFSDVLGMFVGLNEERIKRKLNTRDELHMTLPPQRNMKINSAEQHAIFAEEFQCGLKLTVGFWNISCEL